MSTGLLTVFALLFPPVWGSIAFWVLKKLWPQRPDEPVRSAPRISSPPIDYQI
jgi:hypothetical protein